MDWSHQTVLVTGAGGFIGSHLTEKLVSLGARTRALVRYNSTSSWGWIEDLPTRNDVEVILGDIRDRESLRHALRNVDVVFHLAALVGIPYSYQAAFSYVQTNVEGTLNVLQTALDAGVKLAVHTSTSEVYGTARCIPIDESHPLQGQSPYSASKIGADKLAEAFHLTFGLPIAVIRPFNTYGPRQSARAVIPTIIIQALTGSEVRLGNLEPTRDFNYVADIVEGFIRIVEHPEAVGQVINIGSGIEISIKDVATTILRLVSKDIPVMCDDVRVRPQKSEVGRLCADNTRARELIGWRPRYTFESGCAKTIEWIKGNLSRYRHGAYAI